MSESKNGYTSKLFIGALVYALGVLAFNIGNFWWAFYLIMVAAAVTIEVAYQQYTCKFIKKGYIPHCTLLIASAWIGVFVVHQLGSTRRGTAILLIIFLMVVAFDTFSQVGGVIWSKLGSTHKIAPIESKNKTVEGSVVGYVLSIATGVILEHFLRACLGLHDKQPLAFSIFICITPIVAYFGDINESMAKRRLYKQVNGEMEQLKDFSSALYTVGGVSDRYDGQLAAMSYVGFLSWLLLL